MPKLPAVVVDLKFFDMCDPYDAGAREALVAAVGQLVTNFHTSKARKLSVKVDVSYYPPNVQTTGVYPEVEGFRSRDREIPPPVFPDFCPVCMAPVRERSERECFYSCGGTYTEKPQIQNHTDVFWGVCSTVKRKK